MVNDYLVNDCIDRVWCSPGTDTHIALELARLTTDNGLIDSIDLTWSKYKLPTSDDFYHVFMVGQVPLSLLGVKGDIVVEQWMELDTLNNENNTVMNLYSGIGDEIGTSNCYLMRTKYNGILIATGFYRKESLLSNVPIFLRIYKNRYYESSALIPGQETIVYTSFTNLSDSALADFINIHNSYDNLDYGLAMVTYDGKWYRYVPEDTVTREDTLTSFYDGSIESVESFRVGELPSYTSKIDLSNKYLIHLSKQKYAIYYYRDIDFYIGLMVGDNFRGLRIHKNDGETIRQVTHNDYGIDTNLINAFYMSHFSEHSLEDMHIIAHVRNSGKRKPLIYVTDKIRALYRLDDTRIVNALAGIDSTVPFWRAEHLESSRYTKLMSIPLADITTEMVTECYGYCGVSKTLAQTPLLLDPPGSRSVEMPPLLEKAAIVSEYSVDGELIDHYQVYDRPTYIVENDEVGWVEAIAGEGSLRVYQGYDEDTCKVDPTVRYKGYSARRYGDGELGPWVDRSEDGVYQIDGDTLTWNISGEDYLRVVIGEDRLYWFSGEVDYANGNLRHRMLVNVGDEDGDDVFTDMTLPLGSYHIWLNKKALIYKLDYYIDDGWLHIVNKDYLHSDSDKATLVILGHSHCTPDIEPYDPYEIGYVQWGKLYFNDRYDYREDWMDRYIVHGNIYPYELLEFAEDGTCTVMSGTYEPVTIANGMPYMVTPVYPALPTDLRMDYNGELDKAVNRSRVVTDYLTNELPVIPPDRPSIIPRKYVLFSPFMSLAVTDLATDKWILPDGDISDGKLDQLVEGYRWLLRYDPCVLGFNEDTVAIHPHTFSYVIMVDQREYVILERMNDIYLGGHVDLTPHVGINS